MNDKDPLESPTDHPGIGITASKHTFSLYHGDIVEKYSNRN